MHLKKIRSSFCFNPKQSSGFVCLNSIVKYFNGGTIQPFQIGQLKTSNLLGLNSIMQFCKAAKILEFDGERFEATIDELKSVKSPVVIPAYPDGKKLEFLICYQFEDQFLVGDPTFGLTEYTEEELDAIWQIKQFILLKPSSRFKSLNLIKQEKKQLLQSFFDKNALRNFLVCFCLSLLTILFSGKGLLQLNRILFNYELVSLQIYKNLLLSLFYFLLGNVSFFFFRKVCRLYSLSFTNFFLRKIHLQTIGSNASYFENNNEGLFIHQIDKSVDFSEGLRELLLFVLFLFPLIFFILSMLFESNRYVALSGLAELGIASCILMLFRKRIKNRVLNYFYGNQVELGNIIGIFNNIRTLRKYGKTDKLLADLKNSLRFFLFRIMYLGELKNLLTLLYFSLGTFFILFSVLEAKYFEIELHGLITVVFSFALLLTILSRFVPLFISYFKTITFFNYAYDFLNNSSQNVTAATDNSLVFQKLNLTGLIYKYPEQNVLFKGLTLVISDKSVIIIQGNAGSGKTTLCHILQQNLVVNFGDIMINDEVAISSDNSCLTEIISVVPEDIRLLRGSILYNISLETSFNSVGEVIQFCIELGIHNYFANLPNGYLTEVNELQSNVSVNIRKLVIFARALFSRPKILLIDNQLNDGLGDMFVVVKELLIKKKSEMAIVIFTSNKLNVDFADKSYMLKEGILTEEK